MDEQHLSSEQDKHRSPPPVIVFAFVTPSPPGSIIKQRKAKSASLSTVTMNPVRRRMSFSAGSNFSDMDRRKKAVVTRTVSNSEMKDLAMLSRKLEKDGPKRSKSSSASVGASVRSVNRVGFPTKGYKGGDKAATLEELKSSLSRRERVRTEESKNIVQTIAGNGNNKLSSQSMHGPEKSKLESLTKGWTNMWKSSHLGPKEPEKAATDKGSMWKSSHLTTKKNEPTQTNTSMGSLAGLSSRTRQAPRRSKSSDDCISIVSSSRSVRTARKTNPESLFSIHSLRSKKKNRDDGSVVSEMPSGSRSSGRRSRRRSAGGSDAHSVGGLRRSASMSASTTAPAPGSRLFNINAVMTSDVMKKTPSERNLEKMGGNIAAAAPDDKGAAMAAALRQGSERGASTADLLAKTLSERKLDTAGGTDKEKATSNSPKQNISASEHGTAATPNLIKGDMSHLTGTSLADIRQNILNRRDNTSTCTSERSESAPTDQSIVSRAVSPRRSAWTSSIPPETLSAIALIKKRRGRSKSAQRRRGSISSRPGSERSVSSSKQELRESVASGSTSDETSLKSSPSKSKDKSEIPTTKSSEQRDRKSKDRPERSSTSKQQRRGSTTSSRSASERSLVKKSKEKSTSSKQRSRGSMSSRSASERSMHSNSKEKSDSKLPPETTSREKHSRERSRSVHRSGSSSSKSTKHSDASSKLPPETKSSEKNGRGRSRSVHRSSSKSTEKTSSKRPPETKSTDKRGRDRSKSVRRSSTNIRKTSEKSTERTPDAVVDVITITAESSTAETSTENGGTLPPETKSSKRRVRARSRSGHRGKPKEERKKYEVGTVPDQPVEVPEPEPIVETAATRRRERRANVTNGMPTDSTDVKVLDVLESSSTDDSWGGSDPFANDPQATVDMQRLKTLQCFESIAIN